MSVQRWIRGGATSSNSSTHAGGEGICAGRAAKVLTITPRGKATPSRCKRSRAGRTAHRTLSHTIRRWGVHGRGIPGVSDNSSASTTGATSQAAYILGKVVVTADFVSTLPVTSTEGHNAAATHSATVAHGTVMATTMGRWGHHGWGSVAVAIPTHITSGACTYGRERAPETSGASLEVRESAGRASPITRARPILARGEWRKDLGGSIEHAATRRRNLNCLLIKSTTVHTQALRSLLVRRENCEPSAGRLMLLRSSQGPEGNGSSAKLSKPALQFRLGSVVREARHVEDLASFREEGTDVGSGVHWTSENVWMLMRRLGLANETTENTGKGDSLLHRPTGRSWGESLQVERKVVLDGSTGLDWLDLKSGADVGEHGRPEGKRLGMMLLPSLVFSAEVEGTGVLEVGRKDYSLIPSFARKLDTEVPGIEGDEDELKVLRRQVLDGKGIETVNGVPECAGIADMLPGEGGEARAERRNRSVNGLDEYAFTVQLVEALRVKQDPSELDNLSRVLGNINSVLVASGCDVDNHVAVDTELGSTGSRHVGRVAVQVRSLTGGWIVGGTRHRCE